MELIARAQRDDQPVACAYGCTVEGGIIRAGLLFVRAGLPDAPIDFEDPETRQAYRLNLPADFVNLDEDGWDTNQEMKGMK